MLDNNPQETWGIIADVKKNLDTFLSLVGVSSFAAASRVILSEDKRSLMGFLRGLVLAIFASYLVGSFIGDYHFQIGFYHCVVGISGFVADDIFIFVLKSLKVLREDPKAVYTAFLNWIFDRFSPFSDRRKP